jgi:glucose-6-phosphate 1-dehydrogenase
MAAKAASSLRSARQLEPCTLVIFGITGDLAHRKLVPALYDLSCHNALPVPFSVVGFGRKPLSDADMRALMNEAVDDHYGSEVIDSAACGRVLESPHYVQGEFDDAHAYQRLKEMLDEIDRQNNEAAAARNKDDTCQKPDDEPAVPSNRIFYLATPPSLFPVIIRRLGKAGLGGHTGREGKGGWTRIVIEKPFGSDLESARELNTVVDSAFDESQVYRIDHYLAKETVQNLLAFRFANGIFEPVWNRRYIDHVQITAAEAIGVEHRGIYYEESGALRDMIQNHLTQLFTLCAMEPPTAFDAEAVRGEKVKVLRAVRPIAMDEAHRFSARGQYGSGLVDGQPVPAYREEEKVSPTSQTETYAAVKLLVDNWRWQGVPFYLRTGKRLHRQVTEIAIQFKRPPFLMFRRADLKLEDILPNLLVVRIQPDEGISLRIQSKAPGEEMELRPVEMEFNYGSALNELPFSAYETLLVDCMAGDATLFNRNDQVEESWRILMPILDTWQADSSIDTYVAGTWGPDAGFEMMAVDGRAWRRP